MKTLQTFETFNNALTPTEMNAVKGGRYFSANAYQVGEDTVFVTEWDFGGGTGASTVITNGAGNVVYTHNTRD